MSKNAPPGENWTHIGVKNPSSIGIGNSITYETYMGIGNLTIAGSGITWTGDHIGFAITNNGASRSSLYATQASGGVETRSSALLTNINAGVDVLELFLKVNGSSSVDYYYRVNGGALSSATNLNTHVPTGGYGYFNFAIDNLGGSNEAQAQFYNFNYIR